MTPFPPSLLRCEYLTNPMGISSTSPLRNENEFALFRVGSGLYAFRSETPG